MSKGNLKFHEIVVREIFKNSFWSVDQKKMFIFSTIYFSQYKPFEGERKIKISFDDPVKKEFIYNFLITIYDKKNIKEEKLNILIDSEIFWVEYLVFLEKITDWDNNLLEKAPKKILSSILVALFWKNVIVFDPNVDVSLLQFRLINIDATHMIQNLLLRFEIPTRKRIQFNYYLLTIEKKENIISFLKLLNIPDYVLKFVIHEISVDEMNRILREKEKLTYINKETIEYKELQRKLKLPIILEFPNDDWISLSKIEKEIFWKKIKTKLNNSWDSYIQISEYFYATTGKLISEDFVSKSIKKVEKIIDEY